MAPGGGMIAARDADMETNEANRMDMSTVSCYRRALTQVLVISIACMCIPGGYNALTSMAGGIGDPDTCAKSVVWLYAVFSVASILAPAVVNVVGARFALFFGGLGYPFYVLTLLLAGKHTIWSKEMILVGGGIEGLGAALLWTGQGALTFSYAPAHLRGSYFAIFWIVFNLGGVLQSFFTIFLLNLHTEGTSSGDTTFIAFIAVQLFGCALFLTLAPLSKVVRPDGNPVVVEEEPAIVPELKGMLRLLLNPRTLALVPMMLYSNWCYNYQFNQYNAALFDTPTQGLNSTFYWGAQMVAAYFLGFKFLDSPGKPLRKRAMYSLAFVTSLTSLAWAFGAVANYTYHAGTEATWKLIRFDDVSRWILPLLLYILWGAADALVQVWVNWCLSQLTDSPAELSRYAGVYKIFNSLGNLLGSQLNSASYSAQLWINIGLFAASVAPALWVTTTLRSATDGELLDKQ